MDATTAASTCPKTDSPRPATDACSSTCPKSLTSFCCLVISNNRKLMTDPSLDLARGGGKHLPAFKFDYAALAALSEAPYVDSQFIITAV